MSLNDQVAEARQRRNAAFAQGEIERNEQIADGLEHMAGAIRAGSVNDAILTMATRFVQNARLCVEAQAAFYTLTAIGPETPCCIWRVDAHCDGAEAFAGSFSSFDEAQSHVMNIYRRRSATWGIDRVAPGRYATRPFVRGGN